MAITHKERMRRAFNHEPVDRIPTQVNYTQAMGLRMAAHLGVPPIQLPHRLDNHLLVIDHGWLRRTFGDRLAYYGGLSTQTVLSRGSPQEVAGAVRACRAALAPENTGLLLAPSHRLMTDTPVENAEAMLEAFASLEAKPGAVLARQAVA